MTAGPRECRRLIIRGRVQGVGYRAWVAEQAIAAGLAGWVRNRRDGSVEAVLAGAPEAVMAMTAACRRVPPRTGGRAGRQHRRRSDRRGGPRQHAGGRGLRRSSDLLSR